MSARQMCDRKKCHVLCTKMVFILVVLIVVAFFTVTFASCAYSYITLTFTVSAFKCVDVNQVKAE